MTAINLDQFVNAVSHWASARNDQFKFCWPVKGGWEGWVQVDLTGYILALDGAIDILRERPIFKNQFQRVDLLLNSNLEPAKQIPIEIKAESFENHAQFLKGVTADLEKLTAELKSDYAQSVCVMLAIAFSPEALEQVLALTWKDHRIFKSVFMGEVACLVAIYKDKDWIPQ